MNDIVKALRARKSVRVFTDDPIPADVERAIIESAFEAPSAGCQQLYTIIKVTDQAIKDRLAVECDNQPFIARAKMVLVFCADCKKWHDAYKEAGLSPRDPGVGDLMLAVTDTAIAAQNSVVAAESLGVGSCYIGDVMEHCENMRELLALPDYVFPAVMLVFGYPTQQQIDRQKPCRCAYEHIVRENTYLPLEGEELREMLGYKAGEKSYAEWIKAFMNRKYNSDFSREMTRSVARYIMEFDGIGQN